MCGVDPPPAGVPLPDVNPAVGVTPGGREITKPLLPVDVVPSTLDLHSMA